MKCARLQLQERAKVIPKTEKIQNTQRPRRYCQKRLVNPEHDENPTWMAVFGRYHCNADNPKEAPEHGQSHRDNEDLYLSVQTLKFQGDVEQQKRPKTSFKYKTLSDNKKHRMFVKQMVQNDFDDSGRSSQHTCYYFDDYAKYLFSNERSRPNSGKSSLFLQGLSGNYREQKEIRVNDSDRKCRSVGSRFKSIFKRNTKHNFDNTDDKSEIDDIQDAKIKFEKSGTRKSLTISRTQSPETFQIIRVDVVCNYSNPILLDQEDEKNITENHLESVTESKLDNFKNSHFATKYLLTKTVKTLDEHLSGGAKVTLLCKTFKLSERNNFSRTIRNDEAGKRSKVKDVKVKTKIKK
ncbi:uncharacterized protein LOC114252594 [Bombyx mandarina]|nr:uncharacterized protein LOC114252594 [Bombyx mandarina]